MEDDILSLAYELKVALEKSDHVKALKQAEKLMEDSEEVMVLSYQFSRVQTEYNDVLKHYSQNSSEAKTVQKALYEAKKKLDEHELVRNYLKAYGRVREDYEQIQKEIFTPFGEHACKK